MFYLIYRTTNILNDKIYIGVHKTKDIEDTYMGSGTYLNNSIKKYGINCFKREILHVFNNSEEMFKKEAELVNSNFIKEKNNYNLKLDGWINGRRMKF